MIVKLCVMLLALVIPALSLSCSHQDRYADGDSSHSGTRPLYYE